MIFSTKPTKQSCLLGHSQICPSLLNRPNKWALSLSAQAWQPTFGILHTGMPCTHLRASTHHLRAQKASSASRGCTKLPLQGPSPGPFPHAAPAGDRLLCQVYEGVSTRMPGASPCSADMQHLVRATNGVLRQRYAFFVITIIILHTTSSHRVAATAAVYFQRFYLRNDFCVWDPRNIAPACVYLASKTEESPLQAKFLLQYIRSLSSMCIVLILYLYS